MANTDSTTKDNSPKGANEDVIDLEGIVRDIDLTPTNSIVTNMGAAPAPREPLHAEELAQDQIDELLMAESPELAAEMAAIREVATSKDAAEIKLLEQEEPSVDAALHGRSKMTFREKIRFQILKLVGLFKVLKDFAKRSAKDFKGVLREIAIRAKVALIAGLTNRREEMLNGCKWLKSRSTAQKLSLLFSCLALAALVAIATRTVKGTLLPKTEKLWVANLNDHADGSFTYDLNGSFEDFNDPLLHPEFVILIERVVVNLARTAEAPDSANPMAAFELYLQTDNQEAAVEIKDRAVEIKDSLSRAVERMTYPDLVGEEGKAKLKLLIRRDLNTVLTRGKVRRVFFKTIVLNPE